MPPDERDNEERERLIHQYRLLDVQVGQLITLVEVQHELRSMRGDQIRLRQLGLEGMLAGALTMLLAGVPIVYSLSPTTPWISVVVAIIAFGYTVRLVQQITGQLKERKALAELLPAGNNELVEDQPYYIQTRVSGRGTLLSVANQILACGFEEGDVRAEKFKRNVQYWRTLLDEERSEAHRLQDSGAISREAFDEIISWIEQALMQPDGRA